jgi:dTDP-4-amino-4,6-dideoxygalactose transaminase
VRIPVNDLRRQSDRLAWEISTAVTRVLTRGWFILGPELEAFEQEFAAWCGAAHAIGVANGTDALELALRAAGVPPGSEVASVANAGMYATTAILQAGAVPLYVDVDPVTMNMDPACLRAALSPATAAIIVTHIYGRMAAIRELAAIATERRIPLIEDCAHAPGSVSDGRKAGTWGLFGCFSFYPTKNLGAIGDAGAVISSDPAAAAAVRALRQYGWSAKYHSTLPGGRNSRLDEVQAAVLRTKLPYLDGWNARRREIAAAYDRALAGASLVLPQVSGDDFISHLYVVRSAARERIRAALAAVEIGSDVHYPVPDHLQESMNGVPWRRTPLPVTEQAAHQVLTLPCFPELTAEEIAEIAARVLAAATP